METANRARIEAIIAQLDWVKSTFIGPHEYVVADRSDQARELHALLPALLQEEGYDGKFLRTLYRYVNIGPYRYWIVEDVVNRARNG
jgi:hypothetical protein